MLVIAILILVITFIVYVYNKELTLLEFFGMSLACLTIIGIIYACTQAHIPNDTYYQSGRYNQVEYHPFFVERYIQVHTVSYSCGKSTCTRTYTTTEYARHREEWIVYDSLGQAQYIPYNTYIVIAKDFGNNTKKYNDRRRFTHGGVRTKGDSATYIVYNETNTYKYPTTKKETWYNPLNQSSSLFKTSRNKSDVLAYVGRRDWRQNNRLTANVNFTKNDWDILNTKIYETTKANVILLEVPSVEEAIKIKNEWNSGKCNDIVIAFTGKAKQPTNVIVFGWYQEEILATTLQEFLLSHGITKNSLNGIQHIIISKYKPFDFNIFNYIRREVHPIVIFLTFIFISWIWCLLYTSLINNDERRG